MGKITYIAKVVTDFKMLISKQDAVKCSALVTCCYIINDPQI